MGTSFDNPQIACDYYSVVRDVVRSTLRGLDSPRALAVWLLFDSREHKQLVELACKSDDYIDPVRYRDDYLATEFLKKFEGLHGFSPLETAMETDRSSEQRCADTNQRIRSLFTRDGGSTPTVESILLIARRRISRVLGSFTLDVFRDCRWGPGNTSLSKGAHTSAYNKFTEHTVDVSSSALGYLRAYVGTSPIWAASLLGVKPEGEFCLLTNCFKIVEHNRLTFVPKNAKTHRSICVEPHGNTWLQLGVGRFLRRRLLERADIDLNDQSRNQRLAKQGSIDGSLATIDLSAASDSVATELVSYLLPSDWFELLDRLRVHSTKMPDQSVRRNEKFSSMGNGFTFELESLIFWSLATAACEVAGVTTNSTSIYGDDIIVPVEVEPLLKEALLYCGFKYNDQKSFVSGSFRESCGTDWFNGTNVRPFFIKEVPKTVNCLIELANKIRLYSWGGSYGCDKRYKRAYQSVLKALPQNIVIPRVPVHDRTGGLISNQSEANAIFRARGGWQGWTYKRYVFNSTKRPMKRWNSALAAVLSSGAQDTRGYYTLRGSGKFRISSGYSIEWPELGPWL